MREDRHGGPRRRCRASPVYMHLGNPPQLLSSDGTCLVRPRAYVDHQILEAEITGKYMLDLFSNTMNTDPKYASHKSSPHVSQLKTSIVPSAGLKSDIRSHGTLQRGLRTELHRLWDTHNSVKLNEHCVLAQRQRTIGAANERSDIHPKISRALTYSTCQVRLRETLLSHMRFARTQPHT